MNELKLFNFKKKNVRIILKDKEPYFCLKDVCDVLEIINITDVKNRLDLKGVDYIEHLSPGGKQKTLFINEPNLYRAIFQSRKKEAKNFQNWVFNKVLPEIRKTGSYTKEEVNRIVSKQVRKSLTDAIQESGLNDKMHGFAYKSFTDLAYKLVLGMPTKKYKQANSIVGNLRDSLNKFQLKLVSKLENVMKDFIELGLNYQQIKQMILVTLPDVQKKNIKIEDKKPVEKEQKEITL